MTLAWTTAPKGSHRADDANGEPVGVVCPRRFYNDTRGFDTYAVVGEPGALVRWHTWLGYFADPDAARRRLEEHHVASAPETGPENAPDPIDSLI